MDSPQKGRIGRRYDPPQTKGEHVDDVDPPKKWGVMIRISSMKDDSEARV